MALLETEQTLMFTKLLTLKQLTRVIRMPICLLEATIYNQIRPISSILLTQVQ